MKLPKSLWIAGLLLASAGVLRAQLRPEEIADRGRLEEFLRTAEIIKSEPIGEGVTAPWKLTLKAGEEVRKGAWKNVHGAPLGAPDEWRYEIAAYRVDKLLGLNMIPVAVERDFRGKPGALSLWAENKASLLKVVEENIPIPAVAADAVDDRKYITRAFDSLIANDDRTQQNVLFTEDWRTLLIDHSRAFVSDRRHRTRLIYGADGLKQMDDGQGGRKPVLFRRLPRVLVDAIRSLNAAALKAAAGPYLNDQEVEAVLDRKALLLAEIDAMIRRDGEAKVLY